MVRIDAFDEGHCLREDSDVALENTLHHIGDGELTTVEPMAFQIRIDDGGLFHASVDLQACKLGTIFGMVH